MPLEKATMALECILRDIRPKIAIISTPNHDYNRVYGFYVFVFVYPMLLKVFGMHGTFRHDDHHFEMSAEEFEQWYVAYIILS